jgi:glycogen operon protein
MLLGGDELGRTQEGNNNAYCQDDELSWYDWANVDTDLLAWSQALLKLRHDHPVFRRRRFFQGRSLRQLDIDPASADIGWFRPDGQLMTDEDWRVGYAKSLAVLANGSAPSDADRHGRHAPDASFYLALNAWEKPLTFRLPAPKWGGPWQVVVDTSDDKPVYKPSLIAAGEPLPLLGQHFVVLQRSFVT